MILLVIELDRNLMMFEETYATNDLFVIHEAKKLLCIDACL